MTGLEEFASSSCYSFFFALVDPEAMHETTDTFTVSFSICDNRLLVYKIGASLL